MRTKTRAQETDCDDQHATCDLNDTKVLFEAAVEPEKAIQRHAGHQKWYPKTQRISRQQKHAVHDRSLGAGNRENAGKDQVTIRKSGLPRMT